VIKELIEIDIGSLFEKASLSMPPLRQFFNKDHSSPTTKRIIACLNHLSKRYYAENLNFFEEIFQK
jgi:lysylphosphatidylglycerol synthetase-like protein (DUF2156 family)